MRLTVRVTPIYEFDVARWKEFALHRRQTASLPLLLLRLQRELRIFAWEADPEGYDPAAYGVIRRRGLNVLYAGDFTAREELRSGLVPSTDR